MVNIEKVKALLISWGTIGEEEAQQYAALIAAAAEYTQRVLGSNSTYSEDEASYYAASKANLDIILTRGGESITSFTAGDITIKSADNAEEKARALFESVKGSFTDIKTDPSFAFMTV